MNSEQFEIEDDKWRASNQDRLMIFLKGLYQI